MQILPDPSIRRQAGRAQYISLDYQLDVSLAELVAAPDDAGKRLAWQRLVYLLRARSPGEAAALDRARLERARTA
jgi:hypothetical protein